jgi:anaerobic ribonucleoside-triphosphate reductase
MTDQTKPQVKRIPCEVYSRIVGYLRPVQNWNDGKRQEFKDRQVYTLR